MPLFGRSEESKLLPGKKTGETFASSSSSSAEEEELGIIKDEKSLQKWNIAMAVLHGIQAILVLILGLVLDDIKDFRLPFTTSFLAWNGTFPIQETLERSTVRLAPLTSAPAFLSCLAHMLVSIPFALRGMYRADLRRGINRIRWIEYALSSSVMIMLIAMLFGMYDIVSLVLLMGVNICMNLFGYDMELLNQRTAKEARPVDWTPFVFGCIPGLIEWTAILVYLAGFNGVSNIPAFVWFVFGFYLLLFLSFPANMLLQYLQVGRWSDNRTDSMNPRAGYYFGEKGYQVLSLVSKSGLLWLIFWGSNQPNKYV